MAFTARHNITSTLITDLIQAGDNAGNIKSILLSKQGCPPQESERGPYAVVDERCEDTTLEPSTPKPFYGAM